MGTGIFEGKTVSITITNDIPNREHPPAYYIPGKVIDGLWVKFKVVERGYKFEISLFTYGVVLIMFSLVITGLLIIIYWRRKFGFSIP